MKLLPLLILVAVILVACSQPGGLSIRKTQEAQNKGLEFCKLVSETMSSVFIVYDLKAESCGLVFETDPVRLIDSVLERDTDGLIVWLMDGQEITADDFITAYNEAMEAQTDDNDQ